MSGVKHTNVTWWRKKAVNWGLLRAEGILELRPEGCEGADGEQVDRRFSASSEWEGVGWGGAEDADQGAGRGRPSDSMGRRGAGRGGVLRVLASGRGVDTATEEVEGCWGDPTASAASEGSGHDSAPSAPCSA
ncbi:unnamed protein product, partial [Rangifer tarandus platyrhynchus]